MGLREIALTKSERQIAQIDKKVGKGEPITFEEFRLAYLLCTPYFGEKGPTSFDFWVRENLREGVQYLKPQWDALLDAYRVLNERQNARTPVDVVQGVRDLGQKLMTAKIWSSTKEGADVIDSAIRELTRLRAEVTLIQKDTYYVPRG